MSKYCDQCGKKLDDGMAFCHGCGAKQSTFDRLSDDQEATKQKAEQNQNEIKKLKGLVIGTVAVAALLIAVLAILHFGNYSFVVNGQGNDDSDSERSVKKSSYTDPIDLQIEVFFEGKTEKIKELAPAEYWNWYAYRYGRDVKDVIAQMETEYVYMNDYFEDEYGDNISVTYELVSRKSFSEKQYEGIVESLSDRYGLDPDRFGKAYELDLELTINGTDDIDREIGEMSVIEYKGEWYAITWYANNGAYVASFTVG